MEQPQFTRNAAGEIVEYVPAKAPTRDELVADLDSEKKQAAQLNSTVKTLEARRTTLEDEMEAVDAKLKDAYESQEAQNERVAFRGARLKAFDAVPAVDSAPVDGAASEVAQDDAGEATPGQPSAEDVADTLELEPTPAEPTPPSEDVEVPIRRRAGI